MSSDKHHRRDDTLSAWGWSVLLTKATAISTLPMLPSHAVIETGREGRDCTLTDEPPACGLLLKAVAAFFGRRKDGLTFHQYVGYTGVRDYQSGLDAIGIQNLLPSTSKTCAKFAKKHGVEQSRIQLADGTIAQWLGPRKAAKTIILFHGGGYMSPALNEHMFLAFGSAQPPRKDVSTVVLQYG